MITSQVGTLLTYHNTPESASRSMSQVQQQLEVEANQLIDVMYKNDTSMGIKMHADTKEDKLVCVEEQNSLDGAYRNQSKLNMISLGQSNHVLVSKR